MFRVKVRSKGARSLRAILKRDLGAGRAAQPFDDRLDIHPGRRLAVDLDDAVTGSIPALAAGVPSIGAMTSGTSPSNVSSMPMPPNCAARHRGHLLVLVLIHVIGMRIEPGQHSFEGILRSSSSPGHRLDIAPLDLLITLKRRNRQDRACGAAAPAPALSQP